MKQRTWNESYELLKKKGLNHPRKSRLDQWIGDQRRYYKDGLLLDDQISALEKLPRWAWDARRANLLTKLNLIKVYCDEYKSSRGIPRGFIMDGVDLSEFVKSLRKSYELKSKYITAEIVDICEAFPDWSWRPYKNRQADTWHIQISWSSATASVMSCHRPDTKPLMTLPLVHGSKTNEYAKRAATCPYNKNANSTPSNSTDGTGLNNRTTRRTKRLKTMPLVLQSASQVRRSMNNEIVKHEQCYLDTGTVDVRSDSIFFLCVACLCQ